MEAVAQAAQHLKRVRAHKETEWSVVSFALSELATAFENPSLVDYEAAVLDHLTPLATEFCKLFVDLRSKLVADTCDQLGRIVKVTGLAFAPLANLLLRGLANTAKASSVACRNPGFRVFSDVTQYSRFDLHIMHTVFKTSPQERIRVLLFDQIQIALTYWSKEEFEPFYNAVVDMMRVGMRDPSSATRAAARQTFCSFSDIWIERADELVDLPTPPARDLLVQEKPHAAITKAIAIKFDIAQSKDTRQDSIRQRRAAFRKQNSSTAEDSSLFIEVSESSRKLIQQQAGSEAPVRGASPARGIMRGVSPSRPARGASPVAANRSRSPVPPVRRPSPAREIPRSASPSRTIPQSQSPKVNSKPAPLSERPQARVSEYERYLSLTSVAKPSIDQHFSVVDAMTSNPVSTTRTRIDSVGASQTQLSDNLSPPQPEIEAPQFVTAPDADGVSRGAAIDEPIPSPSFEPVSRSPLSDGFLDHPSASSARAPVPRAATNVTTRERRRTLSEITQLADVPVAQAPVPVSDSIEHRVEEEFTPPSISVMSLLENQPPATVEEGAIDDFEDKENVPVNKSVVAGAKDIPSEATESLSAAIAKMKQVREQTEAGEIFHRHMKADTVDKPAPHEATQRSAPSQRSVTPRPNVSTARQPSPPPRPSAFDAPEVIASQGETRDYIRTSNTIRFAAPSPPSRPLPEQRQPRKDATRPMTPPSPPRRDHHNEATSPSRHVETQPPSQAKEATVRHSEPRVPVESRRQPVLKPQPQIVHTGIASKMLQFFCVILAAIFCSYGLIYGATTLREANEMTHEISTRLTNFEVAIVKSHESVRKMDEKYAMWSEYIRELTEQDEANALDQLESIQRQVEQWQVEIKHDLLEFKQSLSRDVIDAALAPLRDANGSLANATAELSTAEATTT